MIGRILKLECRSVVASFEPKRGGIVAGLIDFENGGVVPRLISDVECRRVFADLLDFEGRRVVSGLRIIVNVEHRGVRCWRYNTLEIYSNLITNNLHGSRCFSCRWGRADTVLKLGRRRKAVKAILIIMIWRGAAAVLNIATSW